MRLCHFFGEKSVRIPFVVTFNPALQNTRQSNIQQP